MRITLEILHLLLEKPIYETLKMTLIFDLLMQMPYYRLGAFFH